MITLTRVASDDGYVDPDAIKRAITPETSLVAMTHASNVLGTVQPIEAIAAIVREAGALFLVDAAQSAGVVPIDLRATPIDLLAFPGHKALYGPTGTGALYVGPRTDGKLRPWREGGTGGDSSSPTQPTRAPLLSRRGHAQRAGRRRPGRGHRLGRRARAGRACDATRSSCSSTSSTGPRIPTAGRSPAAGTPRPTSAPSRSIVPESLAPQDLGAILDTSFDIAVRPGLHCAPYIHRALGTFPDGTLRLSPGPFTTPDDIAAFLTALAEITAGVTLIWPRFARCS